MGRVYQMGLLLYFFLPCFEKFLEELLMNSKLLAWRFEVECKLISSDIKACFPSDRNPFYAGFGNRVTDEFSYCKVGIPKGKIFIINPKGEVVVNSCDNKSYTSLHALVNGMFPSMSSEQEDFNSWNFWKLPPPLIDI